MKKIFLLYILFFSYYSFVYANENTVKTFKDNNYIKFSIKILIFVILIIVDILLSKKKKK